MHDHPSAETLVALYNAHTTLWSTLRPRSITVEKNWLNAVMATLAPGDSILDMGCGNGTPVAARLIEYGLQVTGIDASPEMISCCRLTFPEHQWQVADMRTLKLGRRFNALIAWDSFFHLTRNAQRQMFPRFAEHAAAGAHLLFNTGPQNGEAIGSFADQDLYHASLAPDEYRYLLKQSGFEEVRHVAEDPLSGGRTVWLVRKHG